MVTKKYEAAAVYAALGAALSFYLYPFIKNPPVIINGVFFFMGAVISFLVVLRETPFAICKENFLKKKLAAKVFVLFVSASLGFTLGLAGRSGLSPMPGLGLENGKVNAISGVLKQDPRLFNDGRGMGVIALKSAEGGGVKASAFGNITVFFPKEITGRIAEFGRGCELYAEGSVVSSRDGSPLFRASSVFITKSAPLPERLRVSFRSKLLEKFAPSGNGPPWGALASALLLGVRDNLEGDLSVSFRNAGCSHVLALSGMHLALLSGVLAFFLRPVLGYRQAVIAGGIFIIAYVYLAGSQPSLVRAAIMYLLGAVCILGFLLREPLNILCIAFLLQMIFHGEQALSLSFMLSYLALAGILTIGETLRFLFRGRIPEILASPLSASTGAFAATAPVVSLFFGFLSPAGIIAGLVIVPLVSLFMIVSLFALVLLFPFPALFGFFDFILSCFYGAIDFLISLAGKTPGIKADFFPVLVFSAGLSAFLFFLKLKDEKRRGRIDSFET